VKNNQERKCEFFYCGQNYKKKSKVFKVNDFKLKRRTLLSARFKGLANGLNVKDFVDKSKPFWTRICPQGKFLLNELNLI